MHDDSDPPFLPPAPRRRRWLFWIGIPLVLLVAGAVGVYVYLEHQADLAIREALAETDRLEPNGWRLEDLEQQRRDAAPKKEENAAITVSNVKILMGGTWPPRPAAPIQEGPGNEAGPGAVDPAVPAPGAGMGGPMADIPAQPVLLDDRIALPLEVQMDAALTADLRTELDKIKEAVVLADKLADQKEGHHDINWPANPIGALVPWVQDTRSVASMIRFRALVQAQDGDVDGALRSARAILGAGRSLSDDPTLIALLVRIAVQSIAVSSIERTLAQGEPSAEALKLTQHMLEAEVAEPSLQRAMRGERACNRGVCEYLIYGGGSVADLDGPSRSTGGIRASLENIGMKRTVKRGYPVILRTMNECVDIAGLPIEQQKAAWDQMDQKMKRQGSENALARLLLPGLVKVAQSNQRIHARLRTAICALAAERFRQDHKRWPHSLTELTDAKYLSSVPADPYDGKPLRCKELPDGFLVYSVGPDQTDNGGVMNREHPMEAGTDIGFQLWNPERRRQRPAELLPAPTERFDQEIPGIGQPGLLPGARTGRILKPTTAMSLRAFRDGGHVSPWGLSGGTTG
jgi:hypothetical protein